MTIEVTAKKVDEAIKNGLEQLGATLDEVHVEVVEPGGLFRKAKVRLTLERETAETAEDVAAPEKPDSKKPDAAAPEKPEKAQAVAPEKPQESVKRAEQKPQKPAEKPQGKNGDKSAKKAEQPKNGGSAGRLAPEPAEKTKTQDIGEKSEKDGKSAKSDKPAKSAKNTAKKDRDQAKDPTQSDAEKPAEPREKRTREEDAAARLAAVAFVKDIVEKMGFDATVEKSATDEECISITAAEGDDSLLIGRHGETLTALSYIAETAARAEKNRVDIVVDCNGYRERRAASLAAMARRRANECANKRRRIKLEPMERIDRRTIHNALTGDDRVTTASEGKEPYRYVVILPAGGGRRGHQKPRHDKPASQPDLPPEEEVQE